MSGIQPDVTRHTQRSKAGAKYPSKTHNEKKSRSIETDLKLIQKLKSADKDSKTFVIIVFHMFGSQVEMEDILQDLLISGDRNHNAYDENTHQMGLPGTRCRRGKD